MIKIQLKTERRRNKQLIMEFVPVGLHLRVHFQVGIHFIRIEPRNYLHKKTLDSLCLQALLVSENKNISLSSFQRVYLQSILTPHSRVMLKTKLHLSYWNCTPILSKPSIIDDLHKEMPWFKLVEPAFPHLAFGLVDKGIRARISSLYMNLA